MCQIWGINCADVLWRNGINTKRLILLNFSETGVDRAGGGRRRMTPSALIVTEEASRVRLFPHTGSALVSPSILRFGSKRCKAAR